MIEISPIFVTLAKTWKENRKCSILTISSEQ